MPGERRERRRSQLSQIPMRQPASLSTTIPYLVDIRARLAVDQNLQGRGDGKGVMLLAGPGTPDAPQRWSCSETCAFGRRGLKGSWKFDLLGGIWNRISGARQRSRYRRPLKASVSWRCGIGVGQTKYGNQNRWFWGICALTTKIGSRRRREMIFAMDLDIMRIIL